MKAGIIIFLGKEAPTWSVNLYFPYQIDFP